MPRAKPAALDAEKLYEFACRALAGRAHSISEIREKLRRRAGKLGDVDQVMARLKEHGFLDDRRFAEHFASRRVEGGGLGKMRVLRDLRQRRVAPQVAEQAANRAFEGVDEVALIEQFLERKYRNKPLATLREDPKELASAYRRLRYAGFSSGNSIRVLKRYASEAEALESLESPEGEGSEA
jgi:regulatory protein